MVHPITVAVGLGLGFGALLFTLFYGNRFQEENQHNHRRPSNTNRSRRCDLYEPSSDDMCSICLEQLDTNRVQLECKHSFHLKCMKRNVQHGNHFCPNCRQPTSFEL